MSDLTQRITSWLYSENPTDSLTAKALLAECVSRITELEAEVARKDEELLRLKARIVMWIADNGRAEMYSLTENLA